MLKVGLNFWGGWGLSARFLKFPALLIPDFKECALNLVKNSYICSKQISVCEMPVFNMLRSNGKIRRIKIRRSCMVAYGFCTPRKGVCCLNE